ncbi:MAG TPA: hypothetical protein VFK14_11820 [Solirubrobacterales bacterium]|nr:hypothetical protein [Solirubrobacterales bacterium]
MRRAGYSRSVVLATATLLAAGGFAAGRLNRASGEQTQRGQLISALGGELRPLALPRDHPAPVAVHLEGRLRTADGSLLPRVTRLELGLPGQGVLSTKGLPVCPARRLRNTRSVEALAACGPALVGRGQLEAVVALPGQDPIAVHARLLAFNARIGRRRAVLLHAGAASPPTAAVLPLLVSRGSGRFGKALRGRIASALGPWPRLRRFEVTLFRRYDYRGSRRSYLSASCPIPASLTAGFFSFARVSYRFAGGAQIATGIARSCRAR